MIHFLVFVKLCGNVCGKFLYTPVQMFRIAAARNQLQYTVLL